MTDKIYEADCPIHAWFELSYAHWLTVPRIIMEAMPRKWREDMARLLHELDHTFDWRPGEGRYWVGFKGPDGRFARWPTSLERLGTYRHPNLAEIEKIRKEARDED